jgi:hypothetical protein
VRSRCEEDDLEVFALYLPSFNLYDQLRSEVTSLSAFTDKHAEITAGTAGPGWSTVDDVILYKGRIFLPPSSNHYVVILQHAHNMGHEGIQKSLLRLRASFMPQDACRVREFIKGCTTCQRHKIEHSHPTDLLQPLDVPSMVWQDVVMDFVKGFLKVGGKAVILMVVD